MNEQITILFTTFNRLEYTKQSLPVLVKNTEYENIRLIIIDNNSTDGTQEWLEKNKPDNSWVFYNKKNNGVIGAMNQCLPLCGGLMAKVDNDTLVPKKWLTTLYTKLQEHSLFAIGAKHKIMNSNYKTWDDWMENLKKLDNDLYLTNYVGGSGVLFRTEGIKNIPARGRFFGWGDIQEQMVRSDKKIAFHNGVYVDLLDMDADNKYNTDFIDYRLEVGRVKNVKQLL